MAEPSTSKLASALTSLLCLSAAPLALLCFISTSGEPFVEAFREGGWPMFPLLGAALIVPVLLALLAFAFSQGQSWALVAASTLMLAVLGIGAFGMSMGIQGATKAMAIASAVDRGTIMLAAFAESMQPFFLGLCITTGLAGALASSLAVGALVAPTGAQSKRLGLIAATLYATIGALLFAVLKTTAATHEAFRYRGAEFTDVLRLSFEHIGSALQAQRLGLGATLVVALVTAVGVVMLRTHRGAAISLGLTGALWVLIGIANHRGPHLTGDALDAAMAGLPTQPLFEIDGDELHRLFETTIGVGNARLTERDAAPERGDAPPTAIVALASTVDAARLEELLRDARTLGFLRLELVGTHAFPRPSDVQVPPELEARLLAYRTATILVATESCADCVVGKLDETGALRAPWPDSQEGEPLQVTVAGARWTPRALVDAALVASKHHAVLVVAP